MADVLKIYKALADETRLRLVRLLARGAFNVNEIIDILHMGQSRISRHLKILTEAGLVSNRREGTWIYYQCSEAADAMVAELLGHLRRHEQAVPFGAEDLQSLEIVVERRREQTRTFFDSIEDPQEVLHHQSLDGSFYRRIALSLLPPLSAVALDLGTGSGLLLPALLERAERVIAVDASSTMLKLAQQTVGAGAQRCDLRLGDLEHLPVADGEADVVVACMVLHHLSDPSTALAEAHRALKPGGHIAIVDLDRHADESLRERLADLWLGFRPATVRGWLEQLNFTITGTDVVGEPDSLKLITFRGQKQWPKSQIRQKSGRARKKTTK